jgi:hypothetical protein
MKTLSQKIQALFSAVAFAEEGDHRTAIEVANGTSVLPSHKSAFAEKLSRIFSAAAFAEEGLHDEARRIYSGAALAAPAGSKGSFLDVVGLGRAPVSLLVARPKPSFLDVVGLGNARVAYVTAQT